MKKLYTVAEVADLTGYTVGTIREYARIGEIEADKYGNSWRFTEDQIRAFLDKKRKGAKDE